MYTTTLHQILQLAMKAEDAGEAFYRGIASRTQEKTVRDICLFLASEERDHRETLKRFDADVKKDISEKQFSIDVVGLMNQGIEDFKESGFSSFPFHKKEIDVKSCLEIALNAEIQTVKIYQTIQGALLDTHQIVLHHIINEENLHAQTIQNVIDRLTGKKVSSPPAYSGQSEKKESGKGLKKSYSQKDFTYIVLIFMGFLILIFVMMGPKIISDFVEFLFSQ